MSGRIWIVLAGVATGIALTSTLSIAPVVVVATCAAVSLQLRRRMVIAVIGTFVLAMAAGWFSGRLHASDGAELRAAAETYPRCRIDGRILEDLGGLGTLIALGSSDCAIPGRATVVASHLDLQPGTEIAAAGWLRPLGDEGFDRARARAGADAELIVTAIEAGEVEGAAHRAAATFRTKLDDSVDHLPEERQGLILGMTIGDTSRLPGDTEEQLRRAGLTHLLAVSGSNVAIVLGIVALSLHRCSLAARVGCSGAALAFYILIVGPQPSVVRAGAMGAIALVAMWRGAPTQTFDVLALALTALLLARPGLLGSPGLHLSAAATAGIVLWAGHIGGRFHRFPRPVALALGATLAAQFAVAPVLLATFGEMSLVAPLANVLAFPLVAPITIGGLAAGILALVAPGPARAAMSLLSPLAGWIVQVGEITGGAAWAAPATPRWLAWPAAVIVIATAFRTLSSPSGERPGAASREDGPMADWRWTLHDADGRELRTSEAFSSKEEAEAWMGREWAALRDEGADSVSLMEGDTVSYKMSLQEA